MAPYPGGTVELPPWFTLYADGRAIYLDYVLGTLEGTSIGIRHAQLSDDQVNDLITFALDDGGLADARGYYGDNDAATDQDNTVFELRSGRGDRRVVAYGLGDSSTNNPDAAIRTKLELLARRLQNFSTDIANGGGEDLGEYEPEAYLVTLDSPFGPPPNPDNVREWPWADLEPSDFLTLPDEARQLTPEQTAELSNEPLAAPDDLFVAQTEGGISLVRIRALLPDEVVPTH